MFQPIGKRQQKYVELSEKVIAGVPQEQYMELSTTLNARTVLYGLGETAPSTGLPLRRDGVPYTVWAHDTWAGENPSYWDPWGSRGV